MHTRIRHQDNSRRERKHPFVVHDGSGPKAAWTVGVHRLKGNYVPAEVATGLPALPGRSQTHQ